jgi:hypothetical protein
MLDISGAERFAQDDLSILHNRELNTRDPSLAHLALYQCLNVCRLSEYAALKD